MNPLTVRPPVRVTPPSGTPPGTTRGFTYPAPLAFLATLIIVGAGAELIYEVSKPAAVAFVVLVIIGYMAAGGRIDNVTAFLDKIQGLGSN